MGIQTFSYDQVKLFPLTIYKSKFGITQDEQLSNPIVTQLGFWPNKGFWPNSPKSWILVKPWWHKPSHIIKWFPTSIYKPKCCSNQDQQLSNTIGTLLGFWPN